MNPEAQAKLEEILKKRPEELRKDEIAFLKARRDYLKEPQLDEFSSVLKPNPVKRTVKKNAKKEK